MRASLKAELETRFNSISQDSNYLIATYLGPRFKTNYLGVIDAARARQEILLEYLKMSCEESSSSSSSSTPAKKSRGEKTELAVSRKAHDTFWDCFDEGHRPPDHIDHKHRSVNNIAKVKDTRLNMDRKPQAVGSIAMDTDTLEL
ncbi:hypothetical protein EVAR_88818_1 [Eumeta japonica]|uniref:Uncharacterized protein n=1 Tax=Eumeta variegata TaxID=151549 RepID=A0A4C1YK50_EUMVA|nr:hypothetical protein EVAR_88818_1 [Eumeta japonica]